MENNNVLGPHSVVFKEGAPATKLYLVKNGEVLCLKASKDRLIPVFMAKEGDIIGESAMVQDLSHTYSAVVPQYAHLIEIPANDLQAVMEKGPDWLTELATTMVFRFQNTSNLIAENRVIHPSIIDEDQFTSAIEVEFKKLLS